jgi:NadR type nicotinamide-nucleotide adenylyltransferase
MGNDSLKRVAIVGPECTGKSELAKFLAEHYNTQWVPEFARSYIDALDRPYTKEDLLLIAKGQIEFEDKISVQSKKLIICDTTLLVIKIWSEFKYGVCDPAILTALKKRSYDLYLLTHIDLPWEEDPQREHPHQREELFKLYKSEVEKMGVPFIIIRGNRAARREVAIKAIDDILE